jgi:hypothetical protein
MNAISSDLENSIQGTWWLLSREDYTVDGQRKNDPVLGSDPVAMLVYANNFFSAQFMKKDRSPESASQAVQAGHNNTSAIGGYDAYFGTYKIEENTAQVAHTLIGSINPSNIGLTVHRTLKVEDELLTIELETTAHDGEPVKRILTWKRIAPGID